MALACRLHFCHGLLARPACVGHYIGKPLHRGPASGPEGRGQGLGSLIPEGVLTHIEHHDGPVRFQAGGQVQHALIREVGLAEVQPGAAGVGLQGVEDLAPFRLREPVVGQAEVSHPAVAESRGDVGRRPAEGHCAKPQSSPYGCTHKHTDHHGRNGEEEEEESSGWGPLRQGSGCSATTKESLFSDSADFTDAA